MLRATQLAVTRAWLFPLHRNGFDLSPVKQKGINNTAAWGWYRFNGFELSNDRCAFSSLTWLCPKPAAQSVSLTTWSSAPASLWAAAPWRETAAQEGPSASGISAGVAMKLGRMGGPKATVFRSQAWVSPVPELKDTARSQHRCSTSIHKPDLFLSAGDSAKSPHRACPVGALIFKKRTCLTLSFPWPTPKSAIASTVTSNQSPGPILHPGYSWTPQGSGLQGMPLSGL